MNMNEYLDQRIVQMFVGKISHLRHDIKDQFAIRNRSTDPDLSRAIVAKAIRDLRVWRHLLTLLDDNIKWQIQQELDNFKIK